MTELEIECPNCGHLLAYVVNDLQEIPQRTTTAEAIRCGADGVVSLQCGCGGTAKRFAMTQGKKTQGKNASRDDDLVAADGFRMGLRPRADAHEGPYPLWHGWAIVEAYLAGLAAGRSQADPPIVVEAAR